MALAQACLLLVFVIFKAAVLVAVSLGPLLLILPANVPASRASLSTRTRCPNPAFRLEDCVAPQQHVRARPELGAPRMPDAETMGRFANLIAGRRTLEIGGPSDHVLNQLYDILGTTDNLIAPNQHKVFAQSSQGIGITGEGKFVGGGSVRGDVLWGDAHDFDLRAERAPYDLIYASHVLEHMLDPIKALVTWKKHLAAPGPHDSAGGDGGAMLLVLPWRNKTFDKYRPPDLMQKLLRKFHGGPETYFEDMEATLRTWSYFDDPGLIEEANCAHECSTDEAMAALRRRLSEPGGPESLHWHVFDFDLIAQALVCIGMEVVFMDLWPPYHQVVIAKVK